jgi:CHAT domain-containing protein
MTFSHAEEVEIPGLVRRTLRLVCELSVLIACETGLGSQAGCEGLLGLPRAFAVAVAAPSSPVSGRWTIERRRR